MGKLEKEELKKAIDKYEAVEWFIQKGIVTLGTSRDNVCIHYLLWHSFSDVGRTKFIQGLYFHVKAKAAFEGLKEPKHLRVMINYGEELNEYGRLGYVLDSTYIP